MKNRILGAALAACLLLAGCEAVEKSSSSAFDGQILAPEGALNDSHKQLLEEINTNYLPLYGILINLDDWTDANEIPVSMYFAWYRDYINSITSPEERLAQYKIDSPKYQAGWAYPAEEFENFVLLHFDVDIEYLRSSDVFQPDENVYWIPAGGAIKNYQMKVATVDDLSVKEDLIAARVSCSATGDFSDTVYKELKMDLSSGQVKFIGCSSL